MREHDVAAIKKVYADFIKAWESGDAKLLAKCLKHIPFGYVSMFGHAYSVNELTKWFVNPGPEGSKLSITPLQDTVLTQGDEARQYAAILGMIEHGEKHIAFGGSFMNRYEKTEEGWVLETLRFQLQSENATKEEYLDAEGVVHRTAGPGDKSLLGSWLGVDDRVGAFQDKIEHSGNQMITAEIDAPWRAVKAPDNSLTDEEQIMDVLCCTSCAFDFFAMMLAVPAFAAEATVDVGGMFGAMNKRDALTYVKEMRKAMPRCFTGLAVDKLELSGERAAADVRVVTPETYAADRADFTQAGYQVAFVKANGVWAIDKLIRQ